VKEWKGFALDWRAVGQGALVGLLVVVPVSIVQEIVLADDCGGGGKLFAFFLAILAGFFLAGRRAAQLAGSSPYTHGALGGLGTLALWIPLRLAKNLLFGGGLVSSECGEHTVVGVLVSIVTVALLAMSLGILGGLLTSRRPVGR
jgi:hypothetical protein